MAEEKNNGEPAKQNKDIKKLTDKKGLLIAGGIVLIVLALITAAAFLKFGAERLAQRKQIPITRNYNLRGGMGKGGFGKRMGGQSQNRTSGKVTVVSDKKFTIDASGNNVDIQITASTRFPVSSANTVKVGDQVIVSGEKDASGVVQAIRI
jgi:hypothetical protein